MPQGLLPRLLLGLVLAAGLIFALQIWVGGGASQQPRVAAGPKEDPLQESGDDAAGHQVLDTLRGDALLVYLGQRQDKLPQDAAPVLTIEAGGGIRLTVPPPLAARPGREIWPRMGILLPKERLVHLSPTERSSLLRIWSVVAQDGWLQERQIVATDLDFRPEELAPLLKRQRRWQ